MHRLQARYEVSQRRMEERFARAVEDLNLAQEAISLISRFNMSRKKRAGSEYVEVAEYLLNQYPSEVAYFISVAINEYLEPSLGYPPIGQIMVAMETKGGENAARCISNSLRNFPRVETAKLAFGVIKSPAMRALVRAELAIDDAELAEYISSGEEVASPPKPNPSLKQSVSRKKADHQTNLSDGIERMPRRLTDAERRGDQLFLHLQVVSSMLLLLFPVLGGVLYAWPGAGIGLLVGWLARVGMRHSMGLRGSNQDEGFFIRMKERANGSKPGILEALIERIRKRSFTQEQCASITKAWEDISEKFEEATLEEKRDLIWQFLFIHQ